MQKENRKDDNRVESRISIKIVLLLTLNICCCLLLGWFLYTVIANSNSEKVYEDRWLDFFLPTSFIVVTSLLCFIMILYTIVCFNYRIVIDTSLRTMTCFSLLHSKGALLKLDDYSGYYTQQKTTRGIVDGHIARAHQEICYLIDYQEKCHQVMSSMAYSNYKQMKEALGLPEVKR